MVNLREFHSDRELLARTGLQYVEIPCNSLHPERDDVLKFLKIVEDPKNQPVFVHCQRGADRTGLMVAAYRILDQGWTNDEALAEIPNFHFNSIHTGIHSLLKGFDSDVMRKKLADTAAPKIEVVK